METVETWRFYWNFLYHERTSNPSPSFSPLTRISHIGHALRSVLRKSTAYIVPNGRPGNLTRTCLGAWLAGGVVHRSTIGGSLRRVVPPLECTYMHTCFSGFAQRLLVADNDAALPCERRSTTLYGPSVCSRTSSPPVPTHFAITWQLTELLKNDAKGTRVS